ncbi:NADH-quinone oxidoreductase subunit L [Candidatus Margulisiibacteriota bacterium]
MNSLTLAIFMPIVLALPCFAFKRLAKWLALAVSAAALILAGRIFLAGEVTSVILSLHAYILSSGIFLAASFFTLLITVYSFRFMAGKERLGEYYGYILITLGATAGAVFAAEYITLLLFWGILGITLYMLIGLSGPQASSAAKKTFIIVGGADALMILGIALVWSLTGSLEIGKVVLPLTSTLPIVAFLCLAAGAFAKAGAIPLHSWIPDSAEPAHTTVMAYLPAALDKLLGIYLLVRISLDIFKILPNSAMSIFLMIIGSVTIIAAVMGALVQHNLKKLLSFHAVSQVGYMVLGIGTGIPVGIAGGLFHMLNHSIYKACLFLTGGAVEHRTGTTELNQLGGLAKFMPITFVCALVAALSISGVPPFNGFVSKWMVYQGVIELGKTSPYWIIWLLAAMFGSALTLASFMKILHATFLGQWSDVTAKAKEVPMSMWLPMVILAALCVIFGVFAYALPLANFILPSIKGVVYTGLWSPGLATFLIILGLVVGLVIYKLANVKAAVPKPAYVGGELIDEKMIKVSGINFYNTIKNWGPLKVLYGIGETRFFDIYELGSKITFGFSGLLRRLHNGLLHTYLAWMFLGVIILLWVLTR